MAKRFAKVGKKERGKGGGERVSKICIFLKRIPREQMAVESVERDYLWLVAVAGFITNSEALALDV